MDVDQSALAATASATDPMNLDDKSAIHRRGGRPQASANYTPEEDQLLTVLFARDKPRGRSQYVAIAEEINRVFHRNRNAKSVASRWRKLQVGNGRVSGSGVDNIDDMEDDLAPGATPPLIPPVTRKTAAVTVTGSPTADTTTSTPTSAPAAKRPAATTTPTTAPAATTHARKRPRDPIDAITTMVNYHKEHLAQLQQRETTLRQEEKQERERREDQHALEHREFLEQQERHHEALMEALRQIRESYNPAQQQAR